MNKKDYSAIAGIKMEKEELDENCEHSFDDYILEKEQGIVFCTWECSKCKGKLIDNIGEAINPEKGVDY